MQQRIILLQRENLASAVAERIRQMIVEGQLAAGTRINEVHLAARLGLSRTPLREALAALAQEGAVCQVPRIGWFAQPLSLSEFEQIYPIRSFLDPEALRLAGLPDPRRQRRLESLNTRIASAGAASSVVSLDDEWHLELIAPCPNEILLGLIRQFMRRTRRYELALMRERGNVGAARDRHAQILAALRERDLEGACAALRRNLESGFEPIAEWLRAREGTNL